MKKRQTVPSIKRNGGRNVLVTSASCKAPLLRAMQAALRRIDPEARVIAGDIDPEVPTRYVAEAFWQMPRISDEVLPSLIEECHARGIAAILPTRDRELSFWARHRPALAEEGISVIVSNPDAVDRCLDKLVFFRFGQEAGLPVIDTGETLEAVGDGPYVVKERFGSGARGAGIELTLEEARAHAETLDSPIYQPFVPGQEISIDGWIDSNGTVEGVVLRWRNRVAGGESQVTTTFRDEVLERDAARILEALDLRGPVVMQAILADGAMRVIECNPRFGGASTAAIAAGLDTLYWSLLEAFGCMQRPAFHRRNRELRQIRLPTDMVLHDFDL